MKRHLSALLGAVAMVGSPAGAIGQTASSSERLLVIFAAADDPRLERQRALLREVEKSGFSDRDMRIVHVLPDGRTKTLFGLDRSLSPAEALRPPQAQGFAAALVGKDGGVKWRSEEPARPDEIFALIDSMPMRAREMKRNTPKG